MALALVMIEDHAGRTVQLRNDDALGSVDDERARFGHERNFAHVNFLLFNVADIARASFLIDIVHDETNRDLQRSGESHAALAALTHVVLGLFKRVAFEFQGSRAIEVFNRENRFENCLQTLSSRLLGWHVRLQELFIGLALEFNEIRNFHR